MCLTALGWTATGAGHGTFFFFLLAVFPFGIGFLLWPVIALLLANVGESFYRRLFLIAIPVQYALIALYILNWSDELPRIAIAWKYSPANVLEPLVLFLAGHIVIWLTFVRLD